MTKTEFVSYIGKLAHEDMLKTGVLASVTAAQAIIESAYGTSELAVNAHNLFGMKQNLSGNNWQSDWDGSVYSKKTQEWTGSKYITIIAPFRKYKSDAASIKDHSDYLSGAKNGTALRYKGLIGEKNYKTAAQIIKNGGYATSPTYVQTICGVVEKYNLTQYDSQEVKKPVTTGINIIQSNGTNAMYNGARTIKYLVIHYTAGVTSKTGSARNTAGWFRNPSCQGSADFIVDDGEIVQYNPDPRNHSCWAVGGGKYNNKGGRLYGVANNKNCISIEICSNNKTGRVTTPNDANWYFTETSLANAAKLAKYLMQQYGITADRVIRHYDVNGKPCPGIRGWNADSGSEADWEAFRKWIGATGPVSANTGSQTTPQPAAGSTATNYVYVVTVPDLNIRKSPNGALTGKYTGKGEFTIVAESDEWGKLKSGAGWISLDPQYGHKKTAANTAKPSTAKPSTTKPAASKGSPVYRLYSSKIKQHMFTTSSAEKNTLIRAGWTDEGIAWYAPASGVSVYRSYNPKTGDHLFTTNKAEYDTTMKGGWKGEGVAFKAKKNGIPVYRLYNSKLKAHHFTTSDAERNNLIKSGWKDEGRDFYA